MSCANEKWKLLRAGETKVLKQRGHLERGTALGSRGRRKGSCSKGSPVPFNRTISECILSPKAQRHSCPLPITRRMGVPPPGTPVWDRGDHSSSSDPIEAAQLGVFTISFML